MNLRTFGQVKADVARVCGATGMSVTDPRVMQYVNLAVEEILNEGDFPWTVSRIFFRVCNGRVVLPTAYDRILNFSTDGVPQQINSPWFEITSGSPWGGYGLYDDGFYGYGYGSGWYNDGFTVDRDEVFQFRDIPCDQPYHLQVSTQYSELVDSVAPTMVIKGYDADKNPVSTMADGNRIEGEQFTLGVTPVNSNVTFSQLSGIVKPITKGEVYVYVVGLNGDRYHIATFAPKDESPFYRSYQVAGSRQCRPNCILARCRKRYSPITTDNDVVLCGNIPALKKMVQAVWFGDAGKADSYVAYKAIAVDILKKEALAYRGKSRVPAITFQNGFQLGRMPVVR